MLKRILLPTMAMLLLLTLGGCKVSTESGAPAPEPAPAATLSVETSPEALVQAYAERLSGTWLDTYRGEVLMISDSDLYMSATGALFYMGSDQFGLTEVFFSNDSNTICLGLTTCIRVDERVTDLESLVLSGRWVREGSASHDAWIQFSDDHTVTFHNVGGTDITQTDWRMDGFGLRFGRGDTWYQDIIYDNGALKIEMDDGFYVLEQ